jgi:protein TonB
MPYASPPASSSLLRKFGPLLVIIALHAVLFYALQSGLLRHPVVQSVPKEIIASFITLEPAPAPKPEPKPKTVPVVKKTVTPPKPRPVITPKPAPQAITETAPPPAPEPPAEAAPPAPAAPAAPAKPAPPKTISGVAYINAPRPSYPPLDARMGNEGTVTLRVLINEKGRAERVEVQKSSGSLRMDDAARDAVLRALFKPYLEDGKAIPVYAIVPINFTLSK